MTLDQLKYFIDIVETQNITISSKKFYISPQGLSQSLKALQNELQTVLFHSSQGKLTVTAEGHIYYTRIKDLIGQLDQISTELRGKKEYVVSIALSANLYDFVGNLLDSYHVLHPNVLLLIREYPDKLAEEQLLQRKVDLAFLTGPVFAQDIVSDVLAEADDYVCVPEDHPLARRQSLTFQDLKEEPFVILNEQFKTNDCYVAHMKALNYSPKIVFSAASLESLRTALRRKKGISIGNPQYPVLQKGFKAIPMIEKNPWRLAIASHIENSSPIVQELYQYISDHRNMVCLPDI